MQLAAPLTPEVPGICEPPMHSGQRMLWSSGEGLAASGVMEAEGGFAWSQLVLSKLLLF